MAELFLLPTIFILQALAALLALAPFLAYFLYQWLSGKSRNTHNWQPDLKSNVKTYQVDNWAGGHFTISTTPKSPEQVHEEMRTYLREKQK